MQPTKVINYSLFISLCIIPLLSIFTGIMEDPVFRLTFFQIMILVLIFAIIFLYMHLLLRIFPQSEQQEVIYDERKLFNWSVVLVIIGQIAFAINMLRVLKSGISIFSSGREYELVFGQSTIINYFYYLNGFFVSISPIVLHLIRRKKYRVILIALLLPAVISTLFHGVKSTIIFPFLVASFTYWIVNKKIPKMLILVSGVFIIASFVFVNMVVRYGQDNIFEGVFKLILLYLTPSYSNLFYEINHYPQLDFGLHSFDIIYQFIEFFDPNYIKPTPTHYYVDPKYNVGTIFRAAFNDFGYLGFIYYISLISFYLALVVNHYKKRISISSIFILGLTSVQVLFIFWGNHFLKVQFIYWIIISILFERRIRIGANRT